MAAKYDALNIAALLIEGGALVHAVDNVRNDYCLHAVCPLTIPSFNLQ